MTFWPPVYILLTFAIMSKTFTKEEVATHGKKDDMFIIVDDDVYNLTEFQTEHPGK